MHWKDTIIKSSDIKWKSCKPISTDDGKLDINMHIPLTGIVEYQAKKSFMDGLNAMYEFVYELRHTKKTICLQDIATFYEQCGYPEIASQIKSKNS